MEASLRTKIWQQKNPERYRAIQRRFYWRHREERLAYSNKYYKEHREEAKKRYRKFHPVVKIISSLKGNGFDTYIRKAVFERDNYTCQNCGTKERIEIHHKDMPPSDKLVWQKNNNLGNLITLCHKCHIRLHIKKVGTFSKGGYKRNPRRDLEILCLVENFTLSKVGKRFGITRQRVQQIVKRLRNA